MAPVVDEFGVELTSVEEYARSVAWPPRASLPERTMGKEPVEIWNIHDRINVTD
jgi:hypothetical protein